MNLSEVAKLSDSKHKQSEKMLRLCKRNYSVAVDFEPHSVIKVISKASNNLKQPEIPQKKESIVENVEQPPHDISKSNVNAMGIQMISKNLYQQIFKNTTRSVVDKEFIDK